MENLAGVAILVWGMIAVALVVRLPFPPPRSAVPLFLFFVLLWPLTIWSYLGTTVALDAAEERAEERKRKSG